MQELAAEFDASLSSSMCASSSPIGRSEAPTPRLESPAGDIDTHHQIHHEEPHDTSGVSGTSETHEHQQVGARSPAGKRLGAQTPPAAAAGSGNGSGNGNGNGVKSKALARAKEKRRNR